MNIFKTMVLFIALFFNGNVYGEEITIFANDKPNRSTETLYILDGKIAGKYPITIYLPINKDSKSAYLNYYYNNIGEFINFYASDIDNGTKLSFNEVEGSEIINATIDSNMVLKGTWSNSKKSFTIDAKPDINSKVGKLNIELYTTNNSDFIYKLIQIDNPKKIVGIEKINKRLKNVFDSNIKKSVTNEELIRFQAVDILAYVDNSYISLIYYEIEYDTDSGAYPSSYTVATVYSLESGEVLNNIDDLIISKDDPKLVALLQKKLVDKFDGDREIFGSSFEKVRLMDSYYINSTGIIFIYSQEEIAPYVAGTIKVKFSYKELKPFVKKTSKLWHLFN